MQKTLKSRFKYLLPVFLKKFLKYLLYSIEDFFAFISRKKSDGYPPKRLNFVGSAEFKKVGDTFCKYFIDLAGLKKNHTVLDIGSGIGRMAIPLSKFLDKNGEFYGFDIDKRGIDWCKKNLSSKYKNFHFEFSDIYNKYYNKKGRVKGSKYIFPYANNKFDFIFATSVFTHMLPKEVSHYLQEIKRVLKKDGRFFLTFFSLDEEALNNIQQKIALCDFRYKYSPECFYSHKNVPEAETAYLEEWIIKELKKNSLANNLQIYRGAWAKRKKSLSYQDIFISQPFTK